MSLKPFEFRLFHRTLELHFPGNMSLCVRKPTIWVPTRSDTNQPVQSQKQARSLKFWIEKEEELYYPSTENKGTDQLGSYCTADLHLYFHICKNMVFS